jgi:hypothetical protein
MGSKCPASPEVLVMLGTSTSCAIEKKKLSVRFAEWLLKFSDCHATATSLILTSGHCHSDPYLRYVLTAQYGILRLST